MPVEGSPTGWTQSEDDTYADKLAALMQKSSQPINGDGFIHPWRPHVFSTCLELLAGVAAEIILAGADSNNRKLWTTNHTFESRSTRFSEIAPRLSMDH